MNFSVSVPHLLTQRLRAKVGDLVWDGAHGICCIKGKVSQNSNPITLYHRVRLHM